MLRTLNIAPRAGFGFRLLALLVVVLGSVGLLKLS